MSTKLTIIDYQLCNLLSVERACRMVGLDPVISSNPHVIEASDALILPGVGAFPEAMSNLRKLSLIEPIKASIAAKKPLLAICLGLQLLFQESTEFAHEEGLGIIPGTVRKFPTGTIYKVPQIMWNKLLVPEHKSWTGTAFETLGANPFMYFVHSYYVQAPDEFKLAETEYAGLKYTSAIYRNGMLGVQFHPEKSGELGLRIYKNWSKSFS